MDKSWEYISGNKWSNCSAQISPCGKLVLIREYRSDKDNIERTIRIEPLLAKGREPRP
jgi:hypothetical protein